jgi:GT2 family glycosyltransferase
MKLSIIILTCNSLSVIEACIRAVLDTVAADSVEWIIIDNGSSDNSPEIVKRLLPQALVIRNMRNLGVAKARNQGIRAATGEYILLLDDDTEANPHAIDTLMEYLSTHPECALAGPQLLNRDGSYQANALPFPTVRIKFIRIIRKLLGFKLHNPYIRDIISQVPFKPGYLTGACQLIRMKAIRDVGFLDERIFYGPEDADFCLRLKRHGYDVVCLPMVSVMHGYRQQSYHLRSLKLLWHHFTGLIYFWWKHRNSSFKA